MHLHDERGLPLRNGGSPDIYTDNMEHKKFLTETFAKIIVGKTYGQNDLSNLRSHVRYAIHLSQLFRTVQNYGIVGLRHYFPVHCLGIQVKRNCLYG